MHITLWEETGYEIVHYKSKHFQVTISTFPHFLLVVWVQFSKKKIHVNIAKSLISDICD